MSLRKENPNCPFTMMLLIPEIDLLEGSESHFNV